MIPSRSKIGSTVSGIMPRLTETTCLAFQRIKRSFCFYSHRLRTAELHIAARLSSSVPRRMHQSETVVSRDNAVSGSDMAGGGIVLPHHLRHHVDDRNLVPTKHFSSRNSGHGKNSLLGLKDSLLTGPLFCHTPHYTSTFPPEKFV